MKRKTTKQFIEKAKLVHGSKYDYSLTNYINNKTKVKIICPIHGVFEQIAGDHLNNHGCPICGEKNSLKNRTKTTKQFIEKAKLVHNNFYDYSLTNYTNAYTKVKIICPIHDMFEQKPSDHLSGCGCPTCGEKNSIKNRTKTTKQFIEEANKIHNNFYDYSLVDYKRTKTKVKIICPIHGIFTQTPFAHLSKQGCPKCNSSHGENEIRNYLKEKNMLFEEQKKFKELGRLSYDFYLPNKNLLIEYQGIQHYEPREHFGGEKTFIIQQENDKLKKEFAKKHNISLLEISYKENVNDLLDKIIFLS